MCLFHEHAFAVENTWPQKLSNFLWSTNSLTYCSQKCFGMAPPLFLDDHYYLSGCQYFHGSCKWVPNFLDVFLTISTKITHVLWYRNNEPRSLVLLVASITILCTPSTALILHVESPSIAFILAFVTFITALLGSISLYRLSPLHPLAKYPGPTPCKLTKIWMAWISFGGRPHIYYKTLHDKYGPIVRIGEFVFDIF